MVVENRVAAKQSTMRSLAALGRFARDAGPGAATGVALAAYVPDAVNEAAEFVLGVAARDESLPKPEGAVIFTSLSAADQAMVTAWSGWTGTTIAVGSIIGAATSRWKPMRAMLAANAVIGGVTANVMGGSSALAATAASSVAGVAAFSVARWLRGRREEPMDVNPPPPVATPTSRSRRYEGAHRRRPK